jgi:hypothetical protein
MYKYSAKIGNLVLLYFDNMKKQKKYHIVRTIPNSIKKQRSKIGTLPHKYTTAHFPCLVQTIQQKWRG